MRYVWQSFLKFLHGLVKAVKELRLKILLQKTHEQIDLGAYETALGWIKKAQKLRLSHPEFFYTLGLVSYFLNDYEASIFHFNQTLQIDASHRLAQAWRGWAFQKRGLTTESKIDFETATRGACSTYQDWMGQGIALNGLEQYHESIKCFKEATKLNPKCHQAWSNHGYALIYAGENQDAITSFCKALGLSSKYPRAWRGKGIAIAHLGNHLEAITPFEKALDLNDRYHQAWVSKSITLANLERKCEAVGCSDQALKLRPNCPETYYRRGMMFSILGDNKAAITSYDQAINLQANYPKAYYRKGISQAHIESEREEAIKSFKEAINLQANYPDAYYRIAVIHRQLGRSQDAIPNYEKVIGLQPNYPKVWENYLNTLSLLAKINEYAEDVISSCNRAIQLKNDCGTAYRLKADVLMRLDRFKNARDALRHYESAIGCGDNSLEVWFGRGDAEKQLKLFFKAARSYEKTVEIRSDYWEAWDNWGWVVFMNEVKKGGFDEALRIWNLGLESLNDQKSEYVKEGRAKLYYSIGIAHHKKKLYPNAKTSYLKAASLYQMIAENDPKKPKKLYLREIYIEILRDIMQVCRNLKEHLQNPETYQEQLDIAEISLEALIKDSSSPKKMQLRRKFEGFYQLRVDQHVQSGKFMQAFELAEKRKNICLSWFYKNWQQSPNSLLDSLEINTTTAIIYWHISPATITTFILKSDKVLRAIINEQSLGVERDFADNKPKIKHNRLQKFEDWMTAWKNSYQDYRQSNKEEDKSSEEQANHSWRSYMDDYLFELSQILNVPEIIDQYLTDIEYLILIPHRDLHLVPLHALFSFPYSCSRQNLIEILYLLIIIKIPLLLKVYKIEELKTLSSKLMDSKRFITSYLPSLQSANYCRYNRTRNSRHLLSVEHPDSDKSLAFAQIECEAITNLFNKSDVKRISGAMATKQAVDTALRNSSGIFHFTGHGYHDIRFPLNSALLLSGEKKNNRLTLKEILQISLEGYYLVCLSACETGMTSSTNIVDEFVGLGSGFLAQGATCVVSTLWNVPSITSALLMIKFYRFLRKRIYGQHGDSEAESLVKAQEWLRSLTYRKLIRLYKAVESRLPIDDGSIRPFLSDERERLLRRSRRSEISLDDYPYDHPYYWASFTTTGIRSQP
jgi:CHAT domain-containing protein/tetratricopeptide (TPR) repeat protein